MPHRLAFVVFALFVCGTDMRATDTPPVGVTLIPRGNTFKSIDDYSQTILVEGKNEIAIRSAEFEIRDSKANLQIARFPYIHDLGHHLKDERPVKEQGSRDNFSPDDLRRIGNLAPGEYQIAFYLNGIRASNVVSIKIDPDFDIHKAPIFQFGVLEPNPLAKQALPILWIIGPTPANRIFTNYAIVCAPILIDGLEHGRDSITWTGPVGLIFNGPRNYCIIDPSAYSPKVDPDKKHTYAIKYGGYESAPVAVDPHANGLNTDWDRLSVNIKVRPEPLPLLRGVVTGVDGNPIIGFKITARGPVHVVAYTDEKGEYHFSNIPEGTYKIFATASSGNEQFAVMDYILAEKDKTTIWNLNLKAPYSISGKVVDKDGNPLEGVRISTEWEKPQSDAECNSTVTTGTDGTFITSGLYPEISSVFAQRKNLKAHGKNIKPGDSDITLVAKNPQVDNQSKPRTQSKVATDATDMNMKFRRACFNRDEAAAIEVINSGLDVNKLDRCSNAPLSVAAWNGLLEVVKSLVEHGADMNAQSEHDAPALYWAVWSAIGNNPEIIRYMASKGADLNIASLTNGVIPLVMAAHRGKFEMAKALIESGAKIDIQQKDGTDALTAAAKNGHADVVTLLLKRGADVNRMTAHRMNPLMWAAMSGQMATVKALIEGGANVNLKSWDEYGSTALAFASSRGAQNKNYAEVVKYLVGHGAKPSPVDYSGNTPFVLASGNNSAAVMEVLAAAGADLRSKDGEGEKAFTEAIRRKRYESLQTLLKIGINPHWMVDNNYPPIFYAIKIQNDPKLLEILLKGKIDVNAPWFEPSDIGMNECSPLIAATQQGNAAMVEMLLKANANVAYKDSKGKTALDYAKQKDNRAIIRMLAR